MFQRSLPLLPPGPWGGILDDSSELKSPGRGLGTGMGLEGLNQSLTHRAIACSSVPAGSRCTLAGLAHLIFYLIALVGKFFMGNRWMARLRCPSLRLNTASTFTSKLKGELDKTAAHNAAQAYSARQGRGDVRIFLPILCFSYLTAAASTSLQRK